MQCLGYSRLYFAKDRWRITAAVGTMDINFQFYLEDPVASTGNFYDYSTKANFVVLQVQRNIFKRIIPRSYRLIYQINYHV